MEQIGIEKLHGMINGDSIALSYSSLSRNPQAANVKYTSAMTLVATPGARPMHLTYAPLGGGWWGVGGRMWGGAEGRSAGEVRERRRLVHGLLKGVAVSFSFTT